LFHFESAQYTGFLDMLNRLPHKYGLVRSTKSYVLGIHDVALVMEWKMESSSSVFKCLNSHLTWTALVWQPAGKLHWNFNISSRKSERKG